MSTIKHYAKSIAATAADYRSGELDPFTADHVTTWAGQFVDGDRLPVLAELDHILKKTYFSERAVTSFLKGLIKHPKLVRENPAKFWKEIGVLDIQQAGNSQSEMLKRFDVVLQQQIGIGVEDCEGSSGTFIYLDDAIFTGNRVRYDLGPWIQSVAPEKANLHIVVNALHSGGSYYASQQITKASKEAQKSIRTEIWRVREIENRKYYKNTSEVLWPASFPEDDAELSAYIEMLSDAGYPPERRSEGYTPKDGVFSGEAGRDAIEHAFLKAGVRIRSMCPYLPDTARPLGYSKLTTLGFGATVVTYRNCANNCPLALWAGDPWYPLFRRKTN
jgi:hypothetical protein